MIRRDIRRAFRLALRRRDRWEAEVEDEIKLHLTLRAEQLAATGLSADAAYREAVRRFGALDDSRARLYDAARHREQQMRRTEVLGDLRQDLAFALRTLGRQKAWTAITVATLVLGIGATTAVFSVVSSLMLHAVPYPAPDRIVLLQQRTTEGNRTGVNVSINAPAPVIHLWRTDAHGFEAVEPYGSSPAMLRTNGDPSLFMIGRILPSFMTFTGEEPLVGRMFSSAEAASRAPVVLLSEEVWRSRFGARRSVIGQAISLNDTLYTILGVMPAALRLPKLGLSPTDAWVPLDLNDRRHGIEAVARLRRGADSHAIEAELDTIAVRSGVYSAGALPFRSVLVRPSKLVSFHDSLILLTGAVALVLLVACANVAHLLLARAFSRHRELAIRAALGAGRARLFRQLLTESLLLTAAGAAGGIALGWAGLRALVAMHPSGLAEMAAAHLDSTTLAVVLLISVGSGLTFGLLGAAQSFRHTTHDALRSGGRSASHTKSHERLRSLLVVSEMALSATLLVGATLLVRSVVNMQRTSLGFDPHGLYSFLLELPAGRYATPAARASMIGEFTSRVRALPSVRDVAVASVGAGGRSFSVGSLEVDGETPPPPGTAFIDNNGVQPAFFHTMGIPLLEGTTFTDTTAASNQVIVNAGFARRHWPAGHAVGHRIRVAFEGKGDWSTIVGIAGDAMLSGPVTESAAPIIYYPYSDARTPAVYIRTTGTADQIGPLRAILKGIDPGVPSRGVISVTKVVEGSLALPRFTMLVLTSFTALALVLAGVGLYGVMAYGVVQRTREIGIRIALGATSRNIARLVMARGVALAALGALLGLAGAYWGTRFISTMLFGVERLDAGSFAIGGLVLLGAAAAACAVPTRRATSVDPVEAIRGE